MAEQFRVDRPFGDRSTVDSDILSVLPPAVLMNDLRKTFLSNSAFSGNQHRQIGRSYLNGNIYGAQQCLGISDNTETLLHLLYLRFCHYFLLIFVYCIQL